MLSISNVKASHAANYYEQDDYYSQEATTKMKPHWYGKGASILELSGEVDQEQFKSLLQGFAPDGTMLGRLPKNPKTRRAGTDYTFSAPKSVSIAALIQNDMRVIAAHDRAVKTALAVLEERYAQTRSRTSEGQIKVPTGSLIAALYPHQSSRELEPQLHTHAVVINATQLSDGRWQSFSGDAAIANQKLLGEIYQNELAYALKQEGYEIEQRENGQFELVGYSSALLDTFSSRSQQIKNYLKQQELERPTDQAFSAKVKKQATLKTRRHKQRNLDPEKLRSAWQYSIAGKNLNLPTLPKSASEILQQLDPQNAVFVVNQAISHCAERISVFRQSQVERFALEHHLGENSWTELQHAIANNSNLLRLETKPEQLTTQLALFRELDIVQLMQEGQRQVAPITSLEAIQSALDNQRLTNGQRQAVERSITTTDRFIAWQGVAGAGKTYSLNLYRELAESHGYTVTGYAPSAEAAKSLSQSLQISTTTVASLLLSLSAASDSRPAIWIVDEASLLSLKDAQALFKKAEQEAARVVLVGDTRQLSAIEAGNPFKALQVAGIQTVYLEESLRQQTLDLKQAIALIAKGQIQAGITALEKAESVREIPDRAERLDQMVQDYLKLSPSEREQTLLLAGTHAERAELTQRIRSKLRAEDQLGKDQFTVQGLRTKDLTTVQAGYAHHYDLGDVLVPQQDYKKQGLLKGQQYTVIGKHDRDNTLTLRNQQGEAISVTPTQSPKKSVYQSQTLPIAVGDRLRWTKNDATQGIRNGQTFTVTKLEQDHAQICYEDGKSTTVQISGTRFADYAWVSTIYSAQGKTANRVLVAADQILGKEAFYVAASRVKSHLTLYTANIADMAQRAECSRAKENISDYISLFKTQLRHLHAQKQPNHSTGSARSVSRTNFRPTTPIATATATGVSRTNDRRTEATIQQLDFCSRTPTPAVKHPRDWSNPFRTTARDLSRAITRTTEQRYLQRLAPGLKAVNRSLTNTTDLQSAVTRLNASITNNPEWIIATKINKPQRIVVPTADAVDGSHKPKLFCNWGNRQRVASPEQIQQVQEAVSKAEQALAVQQQKKQVLDQQIQAAQPTNLFQKIWHDRQELERQQYRRDQITARLPHLQQELRTAQSTLKDYQASIERNHDRLNTIYQTLSQEVRSKLGLQEQKTIDERVALEILEHSPHDNLDLVAVAFSPQIQQWRSSGGELTRQQAKAYYTEVIENATGQYQRSRDLKALQAWAVAAKSWFS